MKERLCPQVRFVGACCELPAAALSLAMSDRGGSGADGNGSLSGLLPPSEARRVKLAIVMELCR